jgi:hypothetical protein
MAMTDGSSQDGAECWLETEAEMSDAKPEPAAHVLNTVANTLENAPDGRRYDVELTVEERCVEAGIEQEADR